MKSINKVIEVLGEKIEELERQITIRDLQIEYLQKDLKELKEEKKDE